MQNDRASKARLKMQAPMAAAAAAAIGRVLFSSRLRLNATRQVKVPFADLPRTYTHACERQALELSKFMIIQGATRHLDVSWDIIKDIQKRIYSVASASPNSRTSRRSPSARWRSASGTVTLARDLRTSEVV
jgi:hypothetical protein